MKGSDGNILSMLRSSSSNRKSGVHVAGTGSGDILTFQYTLPAETWNFYMTWTQDKTNSLSLYVNWNVCSDQIPGQKQNNFP